MSLSDSTGDERHTDTARTLKILDAVERGDAKSQRALARDMEVALGFANAYLKRCIRKGWIKVRAAPARRYLYYVTPTGFAEKARLTAEYLASSFNFFRTARGQCDEVVERCLKNGYRRIALVGAGDLAEIATLAGLNASVEIVAVIDTTSNQERLAGIPIVRSLAEAGAVDALIVTDIRTPQRTYEQLIRNYDAERVFTPPMLRVGRRRVVVDLDLEESA